MLKSEIYSDNEPHRTDFNICINFIIQYFCVYINNFGLLLPLFVWYYKQQSYSMTKMKQKMKKKRKIPTHTRTRSQHKSRRVVAAAAYNKFLENIITHLNLIFKRIANFWRIPKFDSSIKILFLAFTCICISVCVCMGYKNVLFLLLYSFHLLARKCLWRWCGFFSCIHK